MNISDHMADMQRYRDFRPSPHDQPGLGCAELQDWIVAPCSVTRDSGVLDRCNWEVQVARLDSVGGEYEVHRFSHWACGWFEVALVRPGTPTHKGAAVLACSLADYPVLDEEAFSLAEYEEANLVWAECYGDRERIDYMRARYEQFSHITSQSDLTSVARGRWFAGEASELLS